MSNEALCLLCDRTANGAELTLGILKGKCARCGTPIGSMIGVPYSVRQIPDRVTPEGLVVERRTCRSGSVCGVIRVAPASEDR